MPWKALPFNSERKGTLGQSYGVQGIPTLVLLDPDGKTITANGREMIQSQGAKGFPFGVKLKEEEDKKRKEEKLKEQAILAPKQAALGQEPADGAGVVTIQINTPNGQKTQRRFFMKLKPSKMLRNLYLLSIFPWLKQHSVFVQIFRDLE